MSLPAGFVSALSARSLAVDLWLEIEGIPVAFGMTSRAASFFSGRTARYQRTKVAPVMVGIPAPVEAEVKPLDGDSSIGSLSVRLQEDTDGALLGLVTNVGRNDGLYRLGPTREWAPNASFTFGEIVVPSPDSAAAGKGHIFLCGYTGLSGGTEPDWPAGDAAQVGDSGTWWREAGLQTIPASLAQAVIAIPCSGALSVGSLLYIGRETLRIASIPYAYNGTQRCVCDRAYHELPGHTNVYEHHPGDVISTYPRFVATRRAILYATLDGTDANKVARWAGTVQEVRLSEGLTEFQVDLLSIGQELRRKVFTNQRRGKLKTEIAETQGASTVVRLEPTSLAGAAWPTSGTVDTYFRIDDEIIRGTLSTTEPGVVSLSHRGLFSTAPDKHDAGADVAEVMVIGRTDSGFAEFAATKFSQGDNPLEVVLALLTSRLGDGTNGTYDTLPDGWGAGILSSRVDAAAIRTLRDRWMPWARHIEIVDEPFVLKEKIADILRPFACYPIELLNDVYTVRRTAPPLPDADPVALDADSIVAVPTWEANLTQVIGRLLFHCDYDLASDSFRQVYKGELQGPKTEAQEFYAGIFQTLEIEAKGQYSGNDPNVTGPLGAALNTGAQAAAMSYFEMLKDRYARPTPLVGLEAPYSTLTIERGDVVSVALAGLPAAGLGRRWAAGDAPVLVEILRRSIDDARGKVLFVARQYAGGGNYRLTAPSATVTGSAAGSVLVALHDFSATDGQTDARFFMAGDVVEIHDETMTTSRGTMTVTGVDDAHIYGTVPAGVVATDVVNLASYDQQGAVRRARNAFIATSDGLILGNPAHEFVG